MNDREPVYTMAEIDAAVTFARNAAEELSASDRDADLLDVYDAAFTLKLTGKQITDDDGTTRPVASLDDVLNVNWRDNDWEDYPDAASWVRSWWNSWS